MLCNASLPFKILEFDILCGPELVAALFMEI